jgi:hypothetical protein
LSFQFFDPARVFKKIKIGQATSHLEFMQQHLQAVLDNCLQNLEFEKNDAVDLFLEQLDNLVVDKFKLELPVLLNDSELYFHTVNESLAYDRQMSKTFKFSTKLIVMFLNNKESFDLWVRMERRYFLSQFEELKRDSSMLVFLLVCFVF